VSIAYKEINETWIVGAVRTTIGRHGGTLSSVRPDDLGAPVLEALVERTGVPPEEVKDVYMGCANQAGEDNRNVDRMSLLLARFPEEIAGATVNRLCGSGLEAVTSAARHHARRSHRLYRRRRGIHEPGAVVAAEYARAHGLKPLAKIRSMASAGVPPRVRA
jgi:acetyl-CoA acetyltransferase